MSELDVLYLSPHPDDVAFSAVGQLAHDVAAGLRVGLMTLFAPSEKKGPFAARGRRLAEDRAFAERFGATLWAAELPEAPSRHRRFRSGRVLLAPLRSDEEDEVVVAVQQKILSVIGAAPTQLVAPLGIGAHVDHQIVQRAATRLATERGLSLRYYEDVPYVLVPYTLARCFGRLGFRGPAPTDETLARAPFLREVGAAAARFSAMPFLQHAAPPLFRSAAAASMVWAESRTKPAAAAKSAAPTLHSADNLVECKRTAAACYDSQWRLFFPSLDAMIDQLRDYSKKLGAELVERSWTLTATAE